MYRINELYRMNVPNKLLATDVPASRRAVTSKNATHGKKQFFNSTAKVN
jgi:hypothetical protein